MYIVNGIAYAGEQRPPLKVSGVRPLKEHRLWVRFNTGEAKVFDFTPLLDTPAFAPLKDEEIFRNVYIDFGIACWEDGDIDIAPEYLYEHGVTAMSAYDRAMAEYRENPVTYTHDEVRGMIGTE